MNPKNMRHLFWMILLIGAFVAGSIWDAGLAPRNTAGAAGDSVAGKRAAQSAEQQAIDLLTAVDEVAMHLANYPGWYGEAWESDSEPGVFNVDLYSAGGEEWLGWGEVDMPNASVRDYFVPRELTPEEFQYGRERVEAFVLNDAELLALLGNLDEWGYETYYNRWDVVWETYFWRSIDAYVAVSYFDWESDEVWLDGIHDQNAFEADEREALNRSQAVELAYEAEGLWEALEGTDNWRTYVEHQGDSRYSVSFVTQDQSLFFALVDIATWEILESG